jgi:hypothetical protein
VTRDAPRRLLVALLVCASAGCKRTDSTPHAPPKAPLPEPPAPLETRAPPRALFEALVEEIGAGSPVAIAPGREGVVAVSLDGSRKRTVVPKAVDWVFVDNRSGALWFQRTSGATSELWLLDLMQPQASPEIAVSGLPAHELIAISYAGSSQRDADVVRPANCNYDGCTQVFLDPKWPATKFIKGQYDGIFEEQGAEHARIVAKAQIVAAPRLRELALRGKEGALLLPAASAVLPDTVAAVSDEHCDDANDCGAAQALPGTDLWRVIISEDCGDGCHVRWQMYDPKKEQFIDFRTGRRSAKPIYAGKPGNMSDAFFSRDGAGFVIRGDVYRIDGHKVFTGMCRGGGWLAGQRHVGD